MNYKKGLYIEYYYQYVLIKEYFSIEYIFNERFKILLNSSLITVETPIKQFFYNSNEDFKYKFETIVDENKRLEILKLR
jgi:hypothetical protein